MGSYISNHKIQKQESKINNFLSNPKIKAELKCNGKYNVRQVKRKLREINSKGSVAYYSGRHILYGDIANNKKYYNNFLGYK